MKSGLKKQIRRLWAVFLSICLAVSGGMTASAEEAVASAMKLTMTEGTVEISSKNGKDISVIQGMRLYNGYGLATQAASYAYVSLDAVKAVKLDAVSSAEIREKGKKQELLLKSGNLFFDVKEPLKEDETLNIRTSTMVTGIRGTCGWVKKIDEFTSQVFILEGQVICQVTNPITGKVEKVSVPAGQTAVFTAGGDGTVSVSMRPFTEQEVEGFAAEAVKDSENLQARIAGDGILSVPVIIGLADETLKRDQQQMEQRLSEMERQIAEQGGKKTVTAVFSDSSSGDSGGSSGGSSAGGRQMIQREMPITAAELNQLLQTGDVTLSSPAGDSILAIDSGVTVPAGGTLNIGSGIHTQVQTGQTLQVDGSLTAAENVLNAGTVQNTSVHTFRAQKALNNTGTFHNTGRVIAAGGFYNSGTFTNANLLEAPQVQNTAGTMYNSGTVNGTIVNYGNLVMTAGLVQNGITVKDGSQFTLEGGTVECGTNDAALFSSYDGTDGSGNQPLANLKGGALDGKDGYAINMVFGDLSLSGTIIRADSAGKLIEYSEALSINYNGSGQKEANEVYINFEKDNNGYMIAGISDDIEEALGTGEEGKSVVLLGNLHLESASLTITASETMPALIDLNGCELSLDNGITIGTTSKSGCLYITDSKGSGDSPGNLMITDNPITVNNRGKLVMDGILVSGYGETSSVEYLSSTGHVELLNSEITGVDTAVGSAGRTVVSAYNGSLLIENTSLRAFTNCAVELDGPVELTVGSGTELTGDYNGGILKVMSEDAWVNFEGGRICNESYGGCAVKWGMAIDKVQQIFLSNVQTDIRGRSEDLMWDTTNGPLELSQFGYEAAENSDGYFVLTPLRRGLNLMPPLQERCFMATPFQAVPDDAIMDELDAEDELPDEYEAQKPEAPGNEEKDSGLPGREDQGAAPPDRGSEEDNLTDRKEEEAVPPDHKGEEGIPPEVKEEASVPPDHKAEEEAFPEVKEEASVPPDHKAEEEESPEEKEEASAPPDHKSGEAEPPEKETAILQEQKTAGTDKEEGGSE